MGVIHRRAGSAPGSTAWEGVEAEAYDDPSLAGVRKHELIGEAEGARQPLGFVCVVGPRARSGSSP